METAQEGIQIIEDIHNQPGTPTLEGVIGPLIFADKCQSHFIEMQPGLFCEEHPHDTGSIIYTVRGRWVLCSGGRRHVMQAGSLFWFDPYVPTGYETPFDEGAYLLIFKDGKVADTPEAMTGYLETLAGTLEQRRREGEVFHFAELPDDHPAKVFARQHDAGD